MRRWFVWTVSGFLVGAIATFVVLGAASAGHGTYLPAAALFPFTMLLAISFGTISPALVILALAQYPIYGLVVAAFGPSQRVLPYILIVHFLAAAIALIAIASLDVF